MAKPGRVVVVGAGLAGAKTAQALREQGFGGSLTLVGDEPHPPYERPPLSKGYLQGKTQRDDVFVHPASWYAEHDVELRLGTPVAALRVAERAAELADGTRLPYDRLVLATGSSPRPLQVPGADLDGVLYLRRLDDSDRLRDVLAAPGTRLAIIGGGWIGLEAAAAARAAGLEVTVLEALSLPLGRVLGPEVAPVFADLHRGHGVDLRTDVRIASLRGGPALRGGAAGRVAAVVLEDGSGVEADVVLAGVGITPNTRLAVEAKLAVDNGILVDEHLRTGADDVFAVGDVANAWHPVLRRRIRVEHWANALNQPAVAAANVLGGDEVYARQPYFYTDQYDLGMEYTGYVEPGGYDRVVFRGEADSLEFIVFWLRQGRVLAGMNVNVWDVTDDILALIGADGPVDVARLADPSVPLQKVVS